jgi:uncharacterized RDD family membrane protein YckC
VSDNPYAPPPPGPSGHNPYAPAPQQNPYGSPSSNPYGSNQPQQHNPSAGYNPYAPPSAGADAPWATPMMGEEHMLAERGTRLGAALIDAGLVLGIVMVFFVPALVMAESNSSEAAMIGLFGVGGMAMLSLMIYQWYLISTTGQSLAKKWLGIRILKLDGTLPGFVHGVLLRIWVMSLITNIPFVGGIAGLVDPLLIFGEERRCLHDYIAGTKVVVASSQI